MDSQRYRARLPRSGKVMRRPLQHQSTRRRCWVHGTGVTSRFVRGRSRSASDPGQSVTPRMQRGGSRKCNSFNHRWPPRQHCSSPARQVTTAARRAGHLPPTLTHDALRLSWAQLGSTPVQKDRISARRSPRREHSRLSGRETSFSRTVVRCIQAKTDIDQQVDSSHRSTSYILPRDHGS